MDVNKQIRAQVKVDLKAALDATPLLPIKRWCNGLPGIPLAADSDLPAIAIAIQEGESKDTGLMNNLFWTGVLIVRVYVDGEIDIDDTLDNYGNVIRKTLNLNYTALGLLEDCTPEAFSYDRDEQSPWGTLDLLFNIEYQED
jgi:hypothetical protein